MKKSIRPNPFHFTEEEESLIAFHCDKAIEYMTSFGKGLKPLMVDTRNYYQPTVEESPIDIDTIKKQRRKQKNKASKS